MNSSNQDNSTWAERQREMLRQQLAARGIEDARVLHAMATTPRELFVPTNLRDAAYDDRALPIEWEQTISQPYTVAMMLQALELQGTERVLEVGTGSGYGAAVLSFLALEVHTVERIPELAESAEAILQQLGYEHVHVHTGDGSLGWPAAAPFDAIVVTAGGAALPPVYLEQLADGGRIVIPLGKKPRSQTMIRYTRRGDRLQSESLGKFAFVPLVGKHGWPDREV